MERVNLNNHTSYPDDNDADSMVAQIDSSSVSDAVATLVAVNGDDYREMELTEGQAYALMKLLETALDAE